MILEVTQDIFLESDVVSKLPTSTCYAGSTECIHCASNMLCKSLKFYHESAFLVQWANQNDDELAKAYFVINCMFKFNRHFNLWSFTKRDKYNINISKIKSQKIFFPFFNFDKNQKKPKTGKKKKTNTNWAKIIL